MKGERMKGGRLISKLLPLPLALLLLGAGGCNLSGPGGSGGGGGSSPPPCVNGQPVEEDYGRLMCDEAPYNLVREPKGYTPQGGITFRLGGVTGGIYRSQYSEVGFDTHDRDESAYGTLFRYYRLPGFPERRFFVGRSFPSHYSAVCMYHEDFHPNPPAETLGKCTYVPYDPERPERWHDPFWWRAWGIKYGPQFGYTVHYSGMDMNRSFYPILQGKDGDTRAQVDLILQLEFPTYNLPPLASWVQPPVVVVASMDRGPYFALDDLLEALRDFKGPAWGRSFEATLRYRFEPLPGAQVRVFFEDHNAQGQPIARIRRAREHDPYPLSQGYFGGDFLASVLSGFTSRRGAVIEALRPENLYRPASDDHYIFELAAGHVTPPAPLCLPGGVVQTLFLVGPYQPRAEPAEPYIRGQGWDTDNAPFGFLNYAHHLVVTQGREARVVNYQVALNRTEAGFGGPTFDGHPLAYPVVPRPGPDPLRGGVERWAVFYRSTPRFNWEPSPGHTLYEDRWKVVWSDVRTEGTPENPRCGVEAIGFHVFSEAESRALDTYLGLAEAETRYLVPGTGYPYGFPNHPPSDDPVGPMLTRLYRPSTDPNARFPETGNLLTAASPGEVAVPVLPPGW